MNRFFYYIVDKFTSGKNNAKLINGLGEGVCGDNHHTHNYNHGLGEGAWSNQECEFCVGGQRHVI